jgi:hypothetical protein
VTLPDFETDHPSRPRPKPSVAMKRDFGSKFMAHVIQGPAKEAHQKILFFRCEMNGVRRMRVGHLL